MKIYSGDVCMGEIGAHVRDGIQTGDIIQLWHKEYAGTEHECWEPVEHLTAVVTDPESGEHYAMGIRSCGFDHSEWSVRVVKKWSDVIDGEHWPAYGFRYSSTT